MSGTADERQVGRRHQPMRGVACGLGDDRPLELREADLLQSPLALSLPLEPGADDGAVATLMHRLRSDP